MAFTCRNFHARDLALRGLTPASAPLLVLLLDVEADLVVSRDGQALWSERDFPVTELTRALAFWLRLPHGERGDFAFDSLPYAEPGAVAIGAVGGGWRFGSALAPDAWSPVVAWERLEPDLVAFIEAVRNDVAGLGVRPDPVPGL